MILQTNVDYMWNTVVNPRLGVAPYTFGGSFVADNPTVGTDCSGAVSAELEALLYGPAMQWPRQFWTGTFSGATPGQSGPFGGVAVTAQLVCIAHYSDAPSDAAMIIAVKQDPDPSNAHMICQVGGVTIEMGGDGNTYHTNKTDPTCSRIDDTSEFNQWFYLPGSAVATNRGVDYAGGRPGGAAIKAAGYSFACRYLFDGSPQLPDKLLTADEAKDLQANGVDVVSNWEASGLVGGGYNQGVSDAQAANANHLAAGGPATAPIYFSVDYDAPESDQPTINAYFQGVAAVIGLPRTGVYGGYWPVKRLFDAGLVTWGWQTEAWSADPAGLAPVGPDGPYLDPRCQLAQRNALGYTTISGVQCDIDEAVTENFGQWSKFTTQPPTPPGGFMALTDQQQSDLYTWVGDVHGALFNPVSSQSPFRAPGEGAIWTTKDFPRNDDGFMHPMYLEWAAKRGDVNSLAELEAVATMTDPTRAADIALAKASLAEVDATPTVPNIPTPTVVPTPAPPAPVAPVTHNPLKVAPMSYLHTITTIIGGATAVGTWVLAHDFLSTPYASALSGGVVALTGLFNFLVKEEKGN